jgi:xanthine/uracil permease
VRHEIGIVGVVNLVMFAAIAAICVRQWFRDRSSTARWAALAFVSLALVAGSGYVLRASRSRSPRRRACGSPSRCS